MGSTPAPPDPAKTAAAQGAWNTHTSTQNQIMNMTNQITPDGTLTYNQIGSTKIQDPSGKWINVPRYEAVTEYSPAQQAIADQSNAASLNLATLANNQSAKLDEYLSNPWEGITNRDAENWAYDLASSRLLPQQEKARKALETQLINSGHARGSQGWNDAMNNMAYTNNDQMNQLALQGRQMAFNESLAARNQPINELTALMSGSQVSNPNQSFVNTPQTQVAGVDYAGLVNKQYEAQLQHSQSKMGGLFGLASAGIGLFSDERLKTDIKRIGKTDAGQNIYSYRYKWGGPVMIGVMAQESPKDAVIPHDSGFLMVDYGKIH